MEVNVEVPRLVVGKYDLEKTYIYITLALEGPISNASFDKENRILEYDCRCSINEDKILSRIPNASEKTIKFIKKVSEEDPSACISCDIAIASSLLYALYNGERLDDIPVDAELKIGINSLILGGLQVHMLKSNKPILLEYFYPIEKLKVIYAYTNKTESEGNIIFPKEAFFHLLAGIRLAQNDLVDEGLNYLRDASKLVLKANDIHNLLELNEIPAFPVSDGFVIFLPVTEKCYSPLYDFNTKVSETLKKMSLVPIITRISRGGQVFIG
ncbi:MULTISPECIES: hypothetical protein [Fervidicoccus]|uniref:Uncharacterized protein n=2 Tax=Fervidicoccus fontis TaxID=683846 RepID=I0A2N1_FERFK|nr:hypothetical protein [Fervidicoccus fontis]AFH43238.1 hypothetical protein FFONT_1250 [Fervidicoccus fontis Kam940]PMB75768.1 MAG: hypothetical protein C0188_01510 [Fervidicoccus fontis]PMB76487.1 MAG: hypothetical protein C0177_05750 [Fervidicoccus fontis]HEW63448.1 hypothetical protein [Fervidicoccus fontis]